MVVTRSNDVSSGSVRWFDTHKQSPGISAFILRCSLNRSASSHPSDVTYTTPAPVKFADSASSCLNSTRAVAGSRRPATSRPSSPPVSSSSPSSSPPSSSSPSPAERALGALMVLVAPLLVPRPPPEPRAACCRALASTVREAFTRYGMSS